MLSTVDLLYLTLAVGIALLTIFLCITLVYTIFILRDVNKITDSAKDTAAKVNKFILKPIQLGKNIVKYSKPLLKAAERKLGSKKTSRTKK